MATVAQRDVIGAKIYWSAAGKKRFRLKNNGGSYLSSHDPREVLVVGKLLIYISESRKATFRVRPTLNQ